MKKNRKKKRINKFTKRDYIAMIISVIGLLFIVCLYLTNNVGWFDDLIYGPLNSIRCDILDKLAIFISVMGSIMAIVAIVLILLFLYPKGKDGLYAVINFIFMLGINNLIKLIVQRDRPFYAMIEQSGFSFPSGHTMGSITLLMTIIYFVDRDKRINKGLKIIINILSIISMILVGLSRIYLGVHYASDVLAGVCISLFEITIFKRYFLDNKR